MFQTTAGAILQPIQEGGVILRIAHQPTYFDDWNKALAAGAPDTKLDSRARDLGELFPPMPLALEPVRYILAWAGAKSSVSTLTAQCWGRQYRLVETHPYEIFALSASFPHLYERFGMQGGGLVPTYSAPLKGESFICGLYQSQSGQRWAQMVNTLLKFYDRTIFIFREPD